MSVLLGTATGVLQLNIDQWTGNAKKAEQSMGELTQSVGKSGGALGKLKGAALGIGDMLAVPFMVGVKAAADLEQNLANVNASLGGLDASTLDQLSDTIQSIGSASKFSANEVALVTDELAKAGYTAEQITGGTLQTVVDLAQATGESLQTATAGVVQAMSVWNPAIVGMETGLTDVTRAADIFTVAANQSAGGVADVIAGLRPLGPVAASMGVGFDQSAAAIALFTQAGLSGAEAGTSLARGLTNLANPTSEAATLMTDLGIAAFDSQGNFVGFPALFDQLKTSMGGMSDQAQLAALSTIFGAEAMDVMGLAILNGSEPLEAMIALMQEQGVAAEQSALRMNTLSAQFGSLKEGAVTLLASFAEGLVPIFRQLVDVGNAALNVFMKIPDPIKQIIGIVGGSLAMFSIITRSIQSYQAISGILNAMGGGATAASFGFGTLAAAIGAVVAILAGLTIAYSYNFLGFRDFVGKVVDGGRGILGFFGDLKDGWDGVGKFFEKGGQAVSSATKPMSAFQRALGGANKELDAAANAAGGTWKEFSKFEKATFAAEFALGKLIDNDAAPDWLRDIAKNTRKAIPQIRNFGKFLGDIWSGSPRKAMDSLALLPPSLQQIAKNLAPAVTGVRDLVSAFQIGGFGSLVREIPQAFGMIGESIRLFVRDMTGGLSIEDWTLTVAAPTIAGWLKDAASDAWGFIATAAGWAWGGIVDLGSWTLTTAVPAVAGWIANQAGNVWGAISTAAGWAWDGLVDLGGWTLHTAAPAVTGWLKLASLFAWDLLKTAAGWAWDGIADLGAWTLDVAAPAVTGWVKNVAGNVWDWVQDAAGWSADIVGKLYGWTLDVAAPNVIGWVTNVAGNAWEWIKDAAGWAADIAGRLYGWTLDVGAPAVIGWVTNVADNIWEWIKDAAGWAANFIGKVSNWTLEVAAPAAVSVLGDIGTAVDDAVMDAYDAYVAGGGYTSIPNAEAKVENVNIDGSDATVTDTTDGRAWYEKGYEYGVAAGASIFDGLNAGVEFLTGSNGGAGGGAGGGVSLFGLFDNFATFLSEGLQGAMDTVIDQLNDPGPFVQMLYDGIVQPFVDVGNQLADVGRFFAPAIDNLISPFKKLGDLDFSGLGSKLADFANRLTDFGSFNFGDIVRGVKDMGGAIGDFASGAFDFGWIDDLIGKLQTVTGVVKDAYKALKDFLSLEADNTDVFGNEVDPNETPAVNDPSLTDPGEKSGTFQLPQSLVDALGGDSGDGGALGRALANAKTAAETKMAEINTSVQTGLTTIGTTITAGTTAWGTTFGTSLQPLLTAINAVFVTAIPANITSGMTNSTAAITTGTTTWGTSFATSAQAILTLANAVFAVAIPANVTTGMTTATASITTETATWTATTGAQSQATLSVVAAVFGNAVPANVASGMTAATNAIQGAAGSWPGIIDGIAGAMGSAGYNAGAAAGFGVANGMASALGQIQSTAAQIAQVVADTMALQLQIHSPSRVTRKLGEQTGEGFALGMEDTVGKVMAAANAVADTAADAMAAAGNVFWDDRRGAWVSTFRDLGGVTTELGRPAGGTTPDTGSTPDMPDKDDWKDIALEGITAGTSDALTGSGLLTDTTAGSLFNEADWLARVAAMGDAAKNINDLFIGRTRVNDTDFSLLGKYLEHYGSPVLPNPPTPNTPLPNTPNNGSTRGGMQAERGYVMVKEGDQYVIVTPDSDQFSTIAANAKRGNVAHGTLSRARNQRTQASGARTILGRV